jgi:hypothetical protein
MTEQAATDFAKEVEAIKALKARYFRLMDLKDWDGLAGVFTPDVVIDMTEEGSGSGVITTVAAYLPFLRANIETVTTVHHGHMPEITLTSDSTATGVWAMEDKLWWPEGSPIVHLHGYGHYHETYEKSGGEWRIKTLKLTRLHREFVLAD